MMQSSGKQRLKRKGEHITKYGGLVKRDGEDGEGGAGEHQLNGGTGRLKGSKVENSKPMAERSGTDGEADTGAEAELEEQDKASATAFSAPGM